MKEVLAKAEEKMKKTVAVLEKELSEIRAGRANPAVLDKIKVDYYGAPTAINQLAAVSVTEARVLVIQPWDKSVTRMIEHAIQKSDLGVNPQSDGSTIRLIFPPLNEERRRLLVKDIAKMCGAPFIKKYINPELQQKDIEAGLAPTEETIINFCGTADLVESDQVKTKVVRPAKMFNEAGEYSEEYLSMLSYLETQVDKAKNENEGIDVISEAKRRLNCFKGNMVDYLIGGMTLSDRNNLKASVEDAVLNCRSAAINGVGYGANYMAFLTLNEMIHEAPYSSDVFVRILFDAYKELIEILYGKSYTKKEIEEDIIPTSISKGCPLNIRTNEYDGNVLSSIKSDVIILETIDKILTLMFTCNQYLVQTPAHNIYIADE